MPYLWPWELQVLLAEKRKKSLENIPYAYRLNFPLVCPIETSDRPALCNIRYPITVL